MCNTVCLIGSERKAGIFLKKSHFKDDLNKGVAPFWFYIWYLPDASGVSLCVYTFNIGCSIHPSVVRSCVCNNWIIIIIFFIIVLPLQPPLSSPPPQASTPYSLDSESLGMDCMISGSASPTLAINTVTNKVLQQAIQPPAPTHTWLHGCTLTPPTSPTTYSTIPHRERHTLVEGRCWHSQASAHVPKASLLCNPHQNTQLAAPVLLLSCTTTRLL